jgi:hypothetical protein
MNAWLPTLLAMAFALPAAAATVVDHIQLGVADVAAGSAQVEQATGVAPRFGGVHPGRGTANALMSLGGRTYLEVIGPAAGQPPAGPDAQQLASLKAPQVRTFAVAADLDTVAAAARKAGLRVDGPRPGSRRTPDGQLLRWRTLNVEDRGFGPFVPFFIDWGDTPHPAMTSPAGATLTRFRVIHPRAAELQSLYRAVGLDLVVEPGEQPRMILEIATPKGPVSWTGGGG